MRTLEGGIWGVWMCFCFSHSLLSLANKTSSREIGRKMTWAVESRNKPLEQSGDETRNLIKEVVSSQLKRGGEVEREIGGNRRETRKQSRSRASRRLLLCWGNNYRRRQVRGRWPKDGMYWLWCMEMMQPAAPAFAFHNSRHETRAIWKVSKKREPDAAKSTANTPKPVAHSIF